MTHSNTTPPNATPPNATPSNTPDAIILACWPPANALLRQIETEPALIPMGDKPMLQRVLEHLVELGCKDVAVVHGNRPQEGEALLGDGERWGCRIRHHYAADGRKPLGLLARLAPADEGNCVLAAADTLALAPLDTGRPCVLCTQEGGDLRWSGWAVLPGNAIRWLADTAQDRADLGHRALTGLDSARCPLMMTDTIATDTVASALAALPRLFAGSSGAQGIVLRPRSAGIWIGNGSRVHPSVRLLPPVFIGRSVLVGENASIGPNVAIGDGCIIDSGSRIEDSILLPSTYVGRKLEVAQAMLSGNHLLNARLGVAMRIPDPELLRDVDVDGDAGRRAGLAQRALAALLWLALAPLRAVLLLRSRGGAARDGASIGVPGALADSYRPLKVRFIMTHEAVHAAREGAWTWHFFATFLPGLADAVAGRVSLVGLRPRTVQQIVSLPHYWQRLYRSAPIGLVNESLLHGAEGASVEMSYAGDALCTGAMPLSQVLGILRRYATRVMAEALASRQTGSGTSRKAASGPVP